MVSAMSPNANPEVNAMLNRKVTRYWKPLSHSSKSKLKHLLQARKK